MKIKEQLIEQKNLILNGRQVDVVLFKIKSIFTKYYLKEEKGIENYKILLDSWNDNYGNYGAHDTLYKREKVAGLLNVMIEDIPDNADLSILANSPIFNNEDYIDVNTINGLENISENSSFKLSRLIQVCKEINSSYKNNNYFAVVVLIRGILDMVPPIFEKSKFSEVVCNVAMSSSHKKQLENLQKSLRNYADGCIHIQLDKVHPYPNKTNINFKSDLSILLELVKEKIEKIKQ